MGAHSTRISALGKGFCGFSNWPVALIRLLEWGVLAEFVAKVINGVRIGIQTKGNTENI